MVHDPQNVEVKFAIVPALLSSYRSQLEVTCGFQLVGCKLSKGKETLKYARLLFAVLLHFVHSVLVTQFCMWYQRRISTESYICFVFVKNQDYGFELRWWRHARSFQAWNLRQALTSLTACSHIRSCSQSNLLLWMHICLICEGGWSGMLGGNCEDRSDEKIEEGIILVKSYSFLMGVIYRIKSSPVDPSIRMCQGGA